jgi:peptidyl-prolyl cis-trans isomerase D
MDAARDQVARTPAKAQDIATSLGLQFFKADGVSAGTPIPEINEMPQLSSAIFTTAKGGVTDVVNSEKSGKSAFAVINNVLPTRNAEYAEVQAQVEASYNGVESHRLAAEAAKAAAERARKGETIEAIAKDYGLTVKTAAPFTQDGAAEGIGSGSDLAAAFKANVGSIVGPVTVGANEFLCRVTDKMPADMNQFAQNKAAIVDSLQQQRQQVQGPLFRDSVVAELKKRGKIKMNDATISRLVGALQG